LVAFVAVSAGLCGAAYLGTKSVLLALTAGVLLPSVGNLILMRAMHGADAFELYVLAIGLVVSFVVSFLTLALLSFSEEDDEAWH
jgi:hypothetical protein